MVYKIILTKEHKINTTNIGHDPFASFLFCFESHLFRLYLYCCYYRGQRLTLT